MNEQVYKMIEMICDTLHGEGMTGVDVHIDDAGVCSLAGEIGAPEEEARAAESANGADAARDAVQGFAADEEMYTVQRGVSYRGIAERLLGDGRKHKLIQAVNRDIDELLGTSRRV